jgi:stage II sporulation protein AA (anti-sigma F factor antagonist)
MLSCQGYAFTVGQTNAYAVVRAEGELDIAATARLRDAVRAAGRRGPRIVLDLRDVTFLDSFALFVIVRLQDEFAGGQTLHVVPGRAIQRVLDVTGARGALRWISPEQLDG